MPEHASPTSHFWDPSYYQPVSDDFSIPAYPQARDGSSQPDEPLGDSFSRTFSGPEQPSSPRVLAQLDPNLHPSTKPESSTMPMISSSRAQHVSNRSIMSIHASTEVAGQELQKLLAFSSRLQSLEDRVETMQVFKQYTEAADSRMQASIQAQNSMLIQLCASIDRLAASSTEATKATTSLAEHSSATAAAAAAATEAQIQHAQTAATASMPGPLARAAAECVVNNAGYAARLMLKGVAQAAAEADVVAAILCHKVLLSEYVPPKASGDAVDGTANGRRGEFLSLRNAKTAGTFLLVLEAAWNLSGRSMRMLPRPLAAIVNPLLQPLRVCMGAVRWTCWAALCYLLARTVQHRCATLRPATRSTPKSVAAEAPPHSPRSAAPRNNCGAPAATPPPPAPAASAVSPRVSPVKAAPEVPSAAAGSAVLTPRKVESAGSGIGRSPLSQASPPLRRRASAVTAEISAPANSPGAAQGTQTGSAAQGAKMGSAAAALGGACAASDGCKHGYADSCPHACSMFVGETAAECDENGNVEAGGGAADGEGSGVGIAGYMMQHGMQMADAARAWASRSRTFVRV